LSIEVKNITKVYGAQKAFNNVSFEVKSGEIVGFLGPNGAGKSTMMKIITCFIPPTEGSIKVCGYDINEQSMDVRRNVGYLPEHDPLYLDMYVKEYLDFIAGIHHLKNRSVRVNQMIERVGLQVEQKKKIGALSKGYRQRVGLAQALIHDPKVLILDEPTTGLDPNQISEIRNVIKEVGKEKTVLFSTHIMQEVKAICDKVLIINKGSLVADDETANLQSRSEDYIVISVEFDKATDRKLIREIKGVLDAVNTSGYIWKVKSEKGLDVRPALFQFAVKNHLSVLGMQKEEKTLEEIFQKLTK
jgi:ABC-2 type transport system ATP-binding protein